MLDACGIISFESILLVTYFVIENNSLGPGVMCLIIGGSGGGMLGARPLWDPILSFLHTFSPKSVHIRGPHLPNGCMSPPYGKSWIRHCL